jgi:hypothetical protein
MSIYGSHVTLLKFQMAPKLILLISSGSKKKEPRYACLCEAKASYSQRMWAKVSSSVPHLLHNGLSSSPSRWRCLFRVLCPVRRPVTTLDWVLLQDRSLALAPDKVLRLVLEPVFGYRQGLTIQHIYLRIQKYVQSLILPHSFATVFLHIPCLYAPLLNLCPLIFTLTPFGWIHSIC